MDKDTILAIVAIVASLIGVLNFLTSARKSLVEELKQEVELLKKRLEDERTQHVEEIKQRDLERKKLRSRVRFLGKLALQRESELNRTLAKIQKWYDWADKMGRAYYELQLSLTTLQQQVAPQTPDIKVTTPLPPLNEDAG